MRDLNLAGRSWNETPLTLDMSLLFRPLAGFVSLGI